MEERVSSTASATDSAVGERVSPLIGFGAVWFGLCCLCWFSMTYQNMMPGCAGPYDERAHFAVGAALGPLSAFWLENESGHPAHFGAALAAVAVLFVALRFRHLLVVRMLAFAVVFAWLSLGCMSGVMRIT